MVIAIELAAGVITILFTGKLDNYKLARKAGDQFDDRIEQAVNTTWTACCGGFNSGAGVRTGVWAAATCLMVRGSVRQVFVQVAEQHQCVDHCKLRELHDAA